LNDIVCDFVRQWCGPTLNGLEHSVPGLVARAYHRVKCVRARSMTRSVAFFLHRGIHGQEKSASICCWRKTVPMIRARSVRRLSLSVHCAFISLNAG
jgi:hypothetical protein